jgi:hypothetical protein
MPSTLSKWKTGWKGIGKPIPKTDTPHAKSNKPKISHSEVAQTKTSSIRFGISVSPKTDKPPRRTFSTKSQKKRVSFVQEEPTTIPNATDEPEATREGSLPDENSPIKSVLRPPAEDPKNRAKGKWDSKDDTNFWRVPNPFAS